MGGFQFFFSFFLLAIKDVDEATYFVWGSFECGSRQAILNSLCYPFFGGGLATPLYVKFVS